jgi:hypothetical protein
MSDYQIKNLGFLVSANKSKSTQYLKVLKSISKDPILYTDGLDTLLKAIDSSDFTPRSVTVGQRNSLTNSLRDILKYYRTDYTIALAALGKIQPSATLRRLAGNKVKKYKKEQRIKKNIKIDQVKTFAELAYVVLRARTQTGSLLKLTELEIADRLDDFGLTLDSRSTYGNGRLRNEETLLIDPKYARKNGQLEIRLLTSMSAMSIRPSYVCLVLSSPDPKLTKDGHYAVYISDRGSKRAIKFFKDDQLYNAARYMNKLKTFIKDELT